MDIPSITMFSHVSVQRTQVHLSPQNNTRTSRVVSCHTMMDEPLRRRVLLSTIPLLGVNLMSTTPGHAAPTIEEMPALKGKNYGKSRTIYPDFVQTDSGLQYKDLAVGTGDRAASTGSTVVVDWSGVTIGYYGRIFEARNKPRGGSFTGDEKDFMRFTVGDSRVIPAFNEALQGMKVGGIRRIIVAPEIGYPDRGFKGYKPEPGSFSGKRTLDFVLQNQGMMDKTLLFDIELLKIVS